MPQSTPSIWRTPHISMRWWPVFQRNLLVWRKLAVASVLGNIADPLIALVAFGYGLGALVGVRARKRLGELWLVRPLLGVGREETEALCARLGLPFTTDPHNRDPRFSRARVRAPQKRLRPWRIHSSTTRLLCGV